jgi:hypothetical protein
MNEHIVVVYKYPDGGSRMVQGDYRAIGKMGVKRFNIRPISVTVYNYFMTTESYEELSCHFFYSLDPYIAVHPVYTRNNPDLYLGSFIGSDLFNPKY